MLNQKTGIVLPNRRKNKKTDATRLERFITKKVIAIAVCEVLSSFAITRFRPNLVYASPELSLNRIAKSFIFQCLLLFFFADISWRPSSTAVH
jgi:hypothetical protein